MQSVTTAIARMLRDAPERAFYENVVTNIEDLSGFVKRDQPSLDEAASMFPLYALNQIPQIVQMARDPHVKAALAGNVDLAVSHATSDVFLEEVAATCAIAGNIEACLEIVTRPVFPVERRTGPIIVACVESFRRGDSARAKQIVDELLTRPMCGSWELVHLTAGLLGREPWGGYPYPDY